MAYEQNKKRHLEEWDKLHEKAKKAENDEYLKTRNLYKGYEAKQEAYGDAYEKDNILQRSADDLDKQKEEEDYKKSIKFSGLKKLLRGE